MDMWRTIGKYLLLLPLLALLGWSVLAIFYSDLVFRTPLAGAAAVTGVLSFFFLSGKKPAFVILLIFGTVLCWWLNLAPSNDRDWQPDVAVLPWAEVRGGDVLLHNIRSAEYRTRADYTVRHYDESVSLKDLSGVDLFVVYWGTPLIAHTMLSFRFGEDRYVCFSIEARKTRDKQYSAVRSFFRQYELAVVMGDERDLVRLRTNFRHEEVYLYHLAFNASVARNVFLEYVRIMNELRRQPQWYNALFNNCTTAIRALARPYTRDAALDWRMVVNGKVDELAYERAMLDTRVPFARLKALSRINDRAWSCPREDFSRCIREGLPDHGHPAPGGSRPGTPGLT